MAKFKSTDSAVALPATSAAGECKVAGGAIMTESAVNECATSEGHPTTKPRSWMQVFAATSALGLCVTAAILGGFWLGSAKRADSPTLQLPSIHASTAATSATMAVATGQVGVDSEGIFFLDFITGDLQCLVYYPRVGAFGARYFTNVLQHLPGGGRNSQYLLVTGTAIPTGVSVGPRPGNCLVYVTDAASGMFAAYAIPWDRTAEAGGRMQSGPLVFVGGGPIRNFQLRDIQPPQQPAAVNAPAAINQPAAVNAPAAVNRPLQTRLL